MVSSSVFALEAAKELEKEGIDVEVIDLRTLVPLDWEAIKKSVSKTHNVVVVQESVKEKWLCWRNRSDKLWKSCLMNLIPR